MFDLLPYVPDAQMWHALDHDQKDWASGSSPIWVIFNQNTNNYLHHYFMYDLFIH